MSQRRECHVVGYAAYPSSESGTLLPEVCQCAECFQEYVLSKFLRFALVSDYAVHEPEHHAAEL